MKKCKFCQSEINAAAKVCPHCNKKQKKPLWLIIVLSIIVISVIGSLFGEEDTSDKPTGTTNTMEKFSLLEGHYGNVKSEYSYEINGTLKNNTEKEYSYIQIEFYTYDSAGNLLDTCLANNSGLEANGSWKFTATCFFGDRNANEVSSYKLKEITHW